MAKKHPTAAALRSYRRGEFTGVEADAIDEHLRHCTRCQNAIKEPARLELAVLRPELKREVQKICQLLHPSDDERALGTTYGMYRLDEFVGAGAMGLVFRGVDLHLRNRPVAVKFMRPSLVAQMGDKSDLVSRFLGDASLAAELHHHNVVAIYASMQLVQGATAIPYFSMEYAPDGPLSRLLESESITLVDALNLGYQVANGLAALHAKGIVHRDLKPQNIVLSGNVSKIADFGIARLLDRTTFTRSTQVLGTPAYMSPEQLSGDLVTEKSDMYSFGTILYQLVVGHLPDRGERKVSAKVGVPSVRTLIQNLRDPSPDVRLNAREAIELLRNALSEAKTLGLSQLPSSFCGETEAVRRSGMYLGGVTFFINKSFGRLQLIPEAFGLRFNYIPIIDDEEVVDGAGFLDMLLPLDAVGGLLATTRAFLYGVESLDENVILQGEEKESESDILVKLYRDKPQGPNNTLTGQETCWLRVVTGRTEEERRRWKLGPRDLLCLEAAFQMTTTLSALHMTHRPRLYTTPSTEVEERPLCQRCRGTRRNVLRHDGDSERVVLCAACCIELVKEAEDVVVAVPGDGAAAQMVCRKCGRSTDSIYKRVGNTLYCHQCYATYAEIVDAHGAWLASHDSTLQLMGALAAKVPENEWLNGVNWWWTELKRDNRDYSLPINECLRRMVETFDGVPSAHSAILQSAGNSTERMKGEWKHVIHWYENTETFGNGGTGNETLPHLA